MRFAEILLAGLFLVLSPAMPAQMALAQTQPPPLSAYGELPGIEDVAISPTGDHIGLITTISAARQLIVMDNSMKPQGSITLGDVKIRGLDFIDDEHILLHTSTTEDLGWGFTQDKFEFFQATIISLAEGKASPVFGNQRRLANATFGSYGIRIINGVPTAFFGALELKESDESRGKFVFDHGRPALYSVDLISNKPRYADNAPIEGYWRDWLVDADGSIFAKLDQQSDNGRWAIRAGDRIIATGAAGSRTASLIAIGQAGDTVIFEAYDDAAEGWRWFEVPVDGSTQPVGIFDDIDIARIFTDPRTGRLIGYLKNDEDRDAVFFDPEVGRKVRLIHKAFRQFHNRLVAWSDDFSQVIVRTDGNGDSGTYFKVDVGALRAEPFGLDRPAIGPDLVGPISTVEYTAGDGLAMDGILTLPPGREARNLPVVMLPHGGPHNQDVEGFDWWAQAFASRGYAVFQPNFRGSTNRDEAFAAAGDGEWGGKMQSDISDGLQVLAEKGIVDPSRACIVGASYGGYAALAGVTLQHGLYRCAVSVGGVADVALMSRIERRESSSKVREKSLARQLGPQSNFKAISPRFHAAEADAPILLIHGRDDTVVDIQQSWKMADALKDAGKPYEFRELEGEDHWLSLAKTRKAMLEAAVAFVEKHNPAD